MEDLDELRESPSLWPSNGEWVYKRNVSHDCIGAIEWHTKGLSVRFWFWPFPLSFGPPPPPSVGPCDSAGASVSWGDFAMGGQKATNWSLVGCALDSPPPPPPQSSGCLLQGCGYGLRRCFGRCTLKQFLQLLLWISIFWSIFKGALILRLLLSGFSDSALMPTILFCNWVAFLYLMLSVDWSLRCSSVICLVP